MVHSLHTIPDIELIDEPFADSLGQTWTKLQLEEKSEAHQDDVEIKIPTLKGVSNWIDFRDSFKLKLRHIKDTQGYSLAYLFDDTPRQILHANTNHLEAGLIDLDDEDTFTTGAVHCGPSFKADNKKLWSLLESLLINKDPYNHISLHSTTKNGKAAWASLKSYFEGTNYVQKIRSLAMDKLKNSTYKGDKRNFKFEDYINLHIKAHKQLLDIQYNNRIGLDDATKIQYFKANILPQADLETA